MARHEKILQIIPVNDLWNEHSSGEYTYYERVVCLALVEILEEDSAHKYRVIQPISIDEIESENTNFCEMVYSKENPNIKFFEIRTPEG